MPTVTITREKMYATPGRNYRFAWKWTYHVSIDGAPSYGGGEHLASLRRALRLQFRNQPLTIIETWKHPALREPGCTGMPTSES